MLDLDDKKHIQLVLDGDTSSFAHIVEKYKNMVFTVCYRILKQREDAEDMAQTSFIKAFNNLHTFNGNSKLSTWLYTIAFRTSISKSQLKTLDTVSDDFHIEIATNDSLPQLDYLKEEERHFYVQKAINELPEMDGVIITLYYLDECSVQEIVEITGISESNIKVKLHRARKQLKTSLEGLLQHEMKSII